MMTSRGALRLVLALAALGACQARTTGSGSGSGSDSGSGSSSVAPTAIVARADPYAHLANCELGQRVVGNISCGSAIAPQDLAMTQKAFAGIVSTAAQSHTEPTKLDTTCAQMLFAFQRTAAKAGCALPLSDDESRALTATMLAYYGQRSPTTPTGDAASDAVIARAVALRDDMCACVDVACLAVVDRKLDTIGALPKTAPSSAKKMGDDVLADIGRCEARVNLGLTGSPSAFDVGSGSAAGSGSGSAAR